MPEKPHRSDTVDLTPAEAGRGGGGVGSPWAVRRPGVVLGAAIVLSLVAHGAVAWVARGARVGRVDPAWLAEASRPIYLKRAASADVFLTRGGLKDGEGTEGRVSLADASELLLAGEPPTVTGLVGEAAMGRSSLAEVLPERVTAPVEVELLPIELADDVLASLRLRVPAELSATGGRGGTGGSDGTGTGGDGGGVGGGGVGGGGGSSEAADLLARTGLSSGPRVEVPDAVLPGLADPLAGLDEPLPPPPLSVPGLEDFTEAALADTTTLPFPEHLDDDFTYHVTRLDPGNGDAGYFRVDITAQRSLAKLDAMPKDVVFLLDTSSSLPQPWIDEAVRGLKGALGRLNEGDRFNVVMFDDTVRPLSDEGLIEATGTNAARAMLFLDAARSRGYTDVDAALGRLLRRDVDAARVYELVLISDGLSTRGVVDSRRLINAITRENDLAASIYTVGIGPKPDRTLLDYLAYNNRGLSVYATKRDRVSGEIIDLMSRLRYPLIQNVRVQVEGDGATVPESELFPPNVPDIHQGQTFSVFGRYTRAGQFTMRLSGTNGGQPVDFMFSRDLSVADAAERDLPRLWATWKLHHLYSRLLADPEDQSTRRVIDWIQRRYELDGLK